MSDKKILIAVYGSLRKGMGNHRVLGDAILLGDFGTPPLYNMFSCGGSYPGITENGETSIKMEVYEASEAVNKSVERLESYVKGREEHNHYNKVMIDTPWGTAGTYIYNHSTARLPRVESGDWKAWKEEIHKEYNLTKV